jgi:glucose/arabinose dehydrogenase
MPQAPKGFKVTIFATGLTAARFMAVAPNGDVLIAESGANKITLLRDANGDGKADLVTTFAEGFDSPSGIAFHNGALYVGDQTAVWRLAYTPGATKAGARTRITKDRFGAPGGHAPRTIAFGPDGALYLAIGSASNIAEDPNPRATVQKVDAAGHLHSFTAGTRNPVGIAFYPGTDKLYIVVNERDGYGDGLVPDYLSQIEQGDFYGWPYAYTGPHADPQYGSKRPDLVAKTRTPDVLFQSHSAPLGLVFYEGDQFPAAYKGVAFVALHGSWNSARPTGYKVVTVKFENGRPMNAYTNFMTGFWVGGTTPAQVWGRPAGLAVAKDGSLLVSDDTSNTIWRVHYKK